MVVVLSPLSLFQVDIVPHSVLFPEDSEAVLGDELYRLPASSNMKARPYLHSSLRIVQNFPESASL